ncbi:MAG: glutamate racemase [Coriobacteriales bacterium]
MNRDSAIGIFDSGFGGLTVVRAIHQALPGESIVYLGDSARCPYGPRPQEEVRGFVRQICRWLTAQDVKLIVIACNTATAAGLAMAQREFDVPVIGVVEPGARAAARATLNRKVGVIATQGTVDSCAYSDAIRARDAGVTVFSTATPRFVEIVEDGLRRSDSAIEKMTADASDVYLRPAFQEIARDYLDPLKKIGIDTLVLGCTHFPILAPLIQQAVGEGVRLISSADETAKDVAQTLERRGQLRTYAAGPDALRFYTTGDDLEDFSGLARRVLRMEDVEVSHISLDEPAAL